jgi:hypothetical protein
MASIDQLFEVPPNEFTQARNALVKELRAAGRDDDAKRAAAMRRPTAALWVANQLARTAPDRVKALIDSAERMRRAHARGAGDELRDAMREQREASQGIARAAEEAARRIGAHANIDLLRRVQETAQAAAASLPDALRSGTLEEELSPTGFDALAGTRVAPVPRTSVKREPPAAQSKQSSGADGHAAKKKEREDQKKQREERHRLERALREAERTAQTLRKAADAAEEKAARARQAADESQAAGVAARRRAQEASEEALALRKKL